MAELVKIDPKSIGVGQYQHDVAPKRLDESLSGVVEDVVNSVGVDLNIATPSLLDRKSTRLNSSHANISYAVFCLKKKKKNITNSAAVHTYQDHVKFISPHAQMTPKTVYTTLLITAHLSRLPHVNAGTLTCLRRHN